MLPTDLFYTFTAECTTKNKLIMARPIKDTPAIWGKDAKRLTEAMENVVPIAKEKREEMKKAYEWFKSIATFPLP